MKQQAQTKRLLGACACIALLQSCSLTAPEREERLETAERIGFSAKMRPEVINTPSVPIYSFSKWGQEQTPLRVYIEGDGFAWESRTRPSNDPTPINPVGLKLAAADPRENILYLARPCQFVGVGSAQCKRHIWTHGRFSQAVLDALNHAIDQKKVHSGLSEVALYGYSGGGALAVLLASQRSDVVEIRTAAANLDIDAWVKHHGVSPMRGSINPYKMRQTVAKIPQIHAAGAKDSIVPSFLAKRFAETPKIEGGCINQYIADGYGHHDAWEAIWPRLLREEIACPN